MHPSRRRHESTLKGVLYLQTQRDVVADFNFHPTLHIHNNKQTEHCKHGQQTEKLSSKTETGNNTNISPPHHQKKKIPIMSFTIKSINR